MDSKLYYTPPTDDIFVEMKEACMAQWATHDNTYGYVDQKHARIKDIGNVQDNFMYMLAMFDDHGKQEIIRGRLGPEARQAVRERMLSGGNSEVYLQALGL